MKTEHRATPLFLGPKLETYMNTKLHKLLPISAAALMFASMATTATADEVVKIGHVAPLTGGIAHLGKDNENGARLAVEEINAKGLTIGGQKITLQLDPQDDAADPRTATQVAKARRRQSRCRGWPFKLRHLDPGIEDLQRCRHRADFDVGNEPGVHAARVQDDVSRCGNRCTTRSGTG